METLPQWTRTTPHNGVHLLAPLAGGLGDRAEAAGGGGGGGWIPQHVPAPRGGEGGSGGPGRGTGAPQPSAGGEIGGHACPTGTWL